MLAGSLRGPAMAVGAPLVFRTLSKFAFRSVSSSFRVSTVYRGVVHDTRSCRSTVFLSPLPVIAATVREYGTPKASWVNSTLKTPIDGIPNSSLNSDKPPDEENEQKKRDESWKKMKYSLIAIGSTLGLFGGALAYSFGSPKIDDEGNVIEDEFSHLPLIQQFFRRMIHQIEYYNKMIKEPSRDKLLPDPVTYPYIQPPYTLVLELKDLLVHPEWTYQTGWRFKKRPGVDKFLEQVGPPNFEVVVYTAEPGLTVFPILDSLDPNGYIMYRLVRDATDFIDGHHVKNLDCLNRDLKKVIVIDWNPNSVKLHANNAFLLPRWKGNDDDTTLVDLAAFLKSGHCMDLSLEDYYLFLPLILAIAANNVEDVRDVLIYYHQFDNPIEAFRENQRRLLEQMEEQEKHERERKQNPPFTSKWSNTFLNLRR